MKKKRKRKKEASIKRAVKGAEGVKEVSGIKVWFLPNYPQSTPDYFRWAIYNITHQSLTVVKSTVFLLIIDINFIKCCHKIKKLFA